MKRLAIPALLLLAACTVPATDPVPAKTTTQANPAATRTVSTNPAATTPAPATNANLDKFEADNAINGSGWHQYVTGREIKYGNSLWIYTSLHPDADAKPIASSICGAYAQYVLVDPKVRTTFVRASDGQQIAKCGPGA